MLVTGVQSVGAKGVSSVQGAVVDIKQASRAGTESAHDGDRSGAAPKAGDPQRVVFPRSGVPMDHRPVDLRQRHAAARYRADGGNHHHHHDDAA